MSIFRHIKTVFSVTTATDQNQEGTIYAVIPRPGDGVSEADQKFFVFFDGLMTGGAGTPTVDVRLLTSHNKTNWIVAAAMTQLVGGGPERHEFSAVTALGPYVRVVSILNGTTKPTHTATVVLAGNGSFDIKEP